MHAFLRIPGDGLLYHIPCLERVLGLAPREDPLAEEHGGRNTGCYKRHTSFGEEGVAKKEALRLSCEALNRNWSLAEAEVRSLY